MFTADLLLAALPTASAQTAEGTSALPIQAFCASAPCLSVTYTLTPPSIPEVAVTPGEVVHFQLGVDPTSVLLDIPQPAGGPEYTHTPWIGRLVWLSTTVPP